MPLRGALGTQWQGLVTPRDVDPTGVVALAFLAVEALLDDVVFFEEEVGYLVDLEPVVIARGAIGMAR